MLKIHRNDELQMRQNAELLAKARRDEVLRAKTRRDAKLQTRRNTELQAMLQQKRNLYKLYDQLEIIELKKEHELRKQKAREVLADVLVCKFDKKFIKYLLSLILNPERNCVEDNIGLILENFGFYAHAQIVYASQICPYPTIIVMVRNGTNIVYITFEQLQKFFAQYSNKFALKYTHTIL